MVAETDVLAITTHCTKLSSLAIYGNRIEGTLAPIWRSLGSTLTRIHIGCYYPPIGFGIVEIIAAAALMEHCVNLYRADVEKLDDAVADVLVAFGSRIRVLNVRNEFSSNIARWHEVCRACTNLEVVHLTLHGSQLAIGIFRLMRTKLVSLTLHDLRNLEYMCGLHEPIPTEVRFFPDLSACSLLKQVQVHLSNLVSETLLHKLFESLKSVTALTCIMNALYMNPKKDVIDAITHNL